MSDAKRINELESALRICRVHAEAWGESNPNSACSGLAFLIIREARRVVPREGDSPPTTGELAAEILRTLERKR